MSWLDFSEHERRQAERIIALFEEKGTVDQLGIGTIRDAISDLLFPGTSVIHSRARYFLFIPWIYLELERKKVAAPDFGRRAAKAEINLITALLQSTDDRGVIGKVARERLKILPSAIYWQGLGRWGIRLFPRTQRDYHRNIDRFYKAASGSMRAEEGEEHESGRLRNWHPAIPDAPDDFPDQAAFMLRPEEAEFLTERIVFSAPGSMLAYLVRHGRPTGDVAFPWEHPQLAELSAANQAILHHGRLFSEVMHGAALLYNLILAEAKRSAKYIEQYGAAFEEWNSRLRALRSDLSRWDEAAFWNVLASTPAQITLGTRSFVQAWCRLVRSGVNVAPTDHRARGLIVDRERALKGPRARLENQRALDLWGGASGAEQLVYRWPVVSVIVNDILHGKRRSH